MSLDGMTVRQIAKLEDVSPMSVQDAIQVARDKMKGE